MGQKVHPESMRVGYIHDWKSQLVHRAPLRRLPRRGRRDPRPHHRQALARRPVRHHDPQGRQRGRGQHPHGAPGHRDRQVRQRGRRAAPGPAPDDAQADQGQHPRDQAPRARRQARRAVDRRAAAEPRRLPPRDEARADRARCAPGAKGCKVQVSGRLGGAEMARTESYSDGRVPLHTLRADIDYGFYEAAHDVRPHRREVLDQQGRDHARGLQRRRPHRARGPAAVGRHGGDDRGARRGAARRPGGGRGRRRRWPRRRPRRRGPAAGRPGGRGGGGGGRRRRWRRWRRRRRRRRRWPLAVAAAVAVARSGGGR